MHIEVKTGTVRYLIVPIIQYEIASNLCSVVNDFCITWGINNQCFASCIFLSLANEYVKAKKQPHKYVGLSNY